MSLVFTLLCTTNQAKDLTIKGTSNFQTKLVEKKGTESEWLNKARKKGFTVNKPKENKNQTLAFGANRDKCKWVREVMSLSRSSISKLESLWRKLTFVQGRQILDAMLIANEILDEKRRSREEGLVFKFDLEKTYDHVD